MATVIRPEISKKNKYRIDKHRHYELKHFCLQYPDWKKACEELADSSLSSSVLDRVSTANLPGDPTGDCVLMRDYYLKRMRIIENVAKQADEFLYEYILKGVTEGLSYTYLQTVMKIPCSRDTYYNRYRKFFWLLNKKRG